MASTKPIKGGIGRGARCVRLPAMMVALAVALGGSAVRAMPVDTSDVRAVPGATERGELDIRDVLDNSTEMDIRLTKQIMLLQRQINELKRQIEAMQAVEADGD